MFHLFNNVYLENVHYYSSEYLNIILGSAEYDHPISKIVNMELGKIPSFDEYLKTEHGGKVDNFWKFLLDQPAHSTFFVYLDQNLYTSLQLQFWKSIFEGNTSEDIYKIYKFYYSDNCLKRMLSLESNSLNKRQNEEIPFLSFEAFVEKFNSIELSEELVVMDKASLSFELLMANYYLKPDSYMGKAFLKKLEDLSWKAFFDNMSILRGEILNSFYDVKRIFPNANIDFTDIESIDEFIQSEPYLRWISDTKFHERNRNQVLRNYTKESLLHITREMMRASVQVSGVSEEVINKIIDGDDQMQIIKSVFDKDYKALLENNIRKNFGCFFVGDDLNQRTNQILPLFVYDKIRMNEINELNFLKVSQV